MADIVKDQMDIANPANLADLQRLAELGKGLAIMPRMERLAVATNVATPSRPAVNVLACYALVGTTLGHKLPVATETTPAAGQVAVDLLGRIVFAAADAVTACVVVYVPVEGELISERIQVTAAGVGTMNSSKGVAQMVSASLVAPAVTAGAKTLVARGTLVGGLAAGQYAVQHSGLTLAFVAAEAGVACQADVVYYAVPGVGTGSGTPFGDRLEAAFEPWG
jgi:hypothetical protein